ncbi:MAG: hypothetical protein LBK05_08760 [Treponema sp.]|nr:hypothetical protein [Treponema sp.]
MTRLMMAETAFWGQGQFSFKMAEKILQGHFRARITDCQIRKITCFIGKRVFDADLQRARAAYENRANMPRRGDKRGVLYIAADDNTINMRKTGNSGTAPGRISLGIVFNSGSLIVRKNEVVYNISEKEYVAVIADLPAFKQLFFECAVRNGYGRYEQTVVLSNGADWVRAVCDELFPDAVQILEFYHLEENLRTFGRYLRQTGGKNFRTDEILSLLKNSRSEEALGKLKRYEQIPVPPGIINPYTHVYNNRGRIDYALYRTRGYYIGNGPIEHENKIALQKRCMQARSKWDKTNAQYILTLRAKEESKLWDRFVRDLILYDKG